MPRTRTTTPQARRRNWCLTLNNPDEDPDTWSGRYRTHSNFKYMVMQVEEGETGTMHYQGYVEFDAPLYFNAVKKLCPQAHLETRKGTAQQARDYCMKGDTRKEGPWEWGEFSIERQGKRLDLERLVELAKTATHKEIMEELPREYCKFYKFVQHVKHIGALDKPTIRKDLRVILCYGKTRCGKTHWAYELDSDLYSLPVGKNLWFDNYNGETTVLLDDFSGQCTLVDLLRILDKYPVQIPRKGGFVWMKATTIIVTCNQHPDTWYDYSNRDRLRDALMARFTHAMEFSEDYSRKPMDIGSAVRPTPNTPLPGRLGYSEEKERDTPTDAQMQRTSGHECDTTIELSSDSDSDRLWGFDERYDFVKVAMPSI